MVNGLGTTYTLTDYTTYTCATLSFLQSPAGRGHTPILFVLT